MNTWFEAKVKYEKNTDDCTIVKANDNYLSDELSFTEAESRLREEMKPYISGEFQVANIKRVKISEIFINEKGGNWYRVKVEYITLDEEKGVEKRVATQMYVQALTCEEALKGIMQGMKGSMADYEIVTITKTQILDIYHYEAEGK
jgi:hypothetical protein